MGKNRTSAQVEAVRDIFDENLSSLMVVDRADVHAQARAGGFCAIWPVAEQALILLRGLIKNPILGLAIDAIIAAGRRLQDTICRSGEAAPGRLDPMAAPDAAGGSDAARIPTLVRNGSDPASIARAQAAAARAMTGSGCVYPHNACAATLSAFLQQAGIDVPMTLGAGRLAARLKMNRGWTRIAVGNQRAGDVGVCYDNDTKIAGADHIYLVVGVDPMNSDKLTIVDNQRQGQTHPRYASGHGGKTPTEYFLRASDRAVVGLDMPDAADLPDEDTDFLSEPFMDDGRAVRI